VPCDIQGLDKVAAWLRCGRVTSEELVTEHLHRIKTDQVLNAVVELDEDVCLAAAAKADRRLRRNDTDGKPICGIPVTVKRTFKVRGFTHFEEDVEAGAPHGFPARRDALIVSMLRQAGAVVLGRTNAPARASDIETWHPRYGRTAHPIDTKLSPGGSSGGSAAAVAAAQAMFDVGSDDAGSARIPAHSCGVFGLRTTLGSLPSAGHVPGPRTQFGQREMLAVSPIARTAEDLSFVWRLLSNYSRDWAGDAARQPIAVALTSDTSPVSLEVAASLQAAVDRLKAAGFDVEDAELPVDLGANWLLCQQLLYAEDAPRDSSTSAPPPPVDAAPIEVALWCADISRHGWQRLKSDRAESQRRWREFFTRYSALLVPVMGTTALQPRDMRVPLLADEVRIGDVPVPTFALSAWCALASVAGLPAVSMPISPGPSGLPVGIQVIAAHGAEALLLELVERLAAEMSPNLPPAECS
jgi:amidase